MGYTYQTYLINGALLVIVVFNILNINFILAEKLFI